MLPIVNRLKNKKDFERVFKEGRGLQSGFLIFKLVKNNLPASRFGFVVGQKVSKKATLRNKVKRRLREAAQISLKRIKQNFDIVVIANAASQNKSLAEIQEVFSGFLKKTKLADD